jgi:hypothetical protein
MLRRRPRFIPPIGSPRPNRKEGVLAAWRGFHARPLEIPHEHPAKSAQDILPGVLTRLRMDQRQKEAEIVKVWNNLLDPTMTEHAQPTGIHKGTLFVTVDNSVWLNEIVRYQRQEILSRLQHSFGHQIIQRISFRIG